LFTLRWDLRHNVLLSSDPNMYIGPLLMTPTPV
jgi:hypothetical protein